MIVRENEKYEKDIRFTGNDISLAATMLDKLSTTIEIIYYLMRRREERSFVVMLISSDEFDVGKIIEKQKRNTDILFKLDEERSIYAIICQDTRIDGGYRFAERMMHYLRENEVKESYCVELEIRNTAYDIKYIIFKLMEVYIETKESKRSNEIVFKSLH